ncbi:hypothetical protein ACFFWC_00835 [Plantactinospora siamensis]|uniref:Uncharacterized protein n=1 Tax=Plantactinospora siamensis TaxID=555372 RepID=A0ABV6NTJ2_9ACTN
MSPPASAVPRRTRRRGDEPASRRLAPHVGLPAVREFADRVQPLLQAA